jgi:hypothetical protein
MTEPKYDYGQLMELMGRLSERLEIETMGLAVIRDEITRISKSIERTAEQIKKEMETK